MELIVPQKLKLLVSSNERESYEEDLEHRNFIEKVMAYYQADEIETTQLDSGDLGKGNVRIELKTSAADFVDSMMKKHGATISRMERQALNLQQYETPIILVVATIPEILMELLKKNPEHPVPLKSVNGYMASIYARYHVPIIPYGALGADYYAYSLLEKGNDGKVPNMNVVKVHASSANEQEAVLQGISGLGGKRANKLLSYFKTLQNIFNAQIDEIKKVDDIGDVTAKNIYDLIRREYK